MLEQLGAEDLGGEVADLRVPDEDEDGEEHAESDRGQPAEARPAATASAGEVEARVRGLGPRPRGDADHGRNAIIPEPCPDVYDQAPALGSRPSPSRSRWHCRAGRARRAPQVTIASAPAGQILGDLRAVAGLSPGLLSAGINDVPAPTDLPRHHPGQPDLRVPLRPRPAGATDARQAGPALEGAVDRADSAPAEIVPGLLASTLEDAALRAPRGAPIEAARRSRDPSALLAADRAGRIGRTPPRCQSRACLPPVEVRNAEVGELSGLVRGLRGTDLLIAIERPPPENGRRSRSAIAGAGFDGDLTSDSTRTGRLRALDRRRADDPRPLRHRASLRDVAASRSAPRARVDPAAIEVARRPDGGDLGAARAGDRAQPADLARRARLWRRWSARRPRRSRRRCGSLGLCRRLPAAAAAASAPRSSRARASNGCWSLLGAPAARRR